MPAPDPAMQTPPPAAEAPAPKNYVTAVIGTTPFFRPKGGPVADYIKDFNPAIGYGRYVTPKLALELDVGLTYISDAPNLTYFLVPGAVYSLSTYLYAAMRAVVAINPDADSAVDVVLYPGFGGFYGLPSGLGFSLELNPAISIGQSATRGSFGVAVNLGVVYSF